MINKDELETGLDTEVSSTLEDTSDTLPFSSVIVEHAVRRNKKDRSNTVAFVIKMPLGESSNRLSCARIGYIGNGTHHIP